MNDQKFEILREVSKMDQEKVIIPGSHRWIGQRLADIDPGRIPIGAMTAPSLCDWVGGELLRVGRVSTTNAFVIELPPLRLLYVRPDYRGYRSVAQRVFAPVAWQVDYDHALARSAAMKLGYRFVLLIRLSPRVNRGHGCFESDVSPSADIPPLAFANRRITDKWLGRMPLLWGRDPIRLGPYDPALSPAIGLTLKQLGQWGHALGVEDFDRSLDGLSSANSWLH